MTNTAILTESTTLPDLTKLRDQAKQHHKGCWHSVQLELETITPVYGGGTSAGEPDLLLPFRPRAVKNSLRHWWWLLNRHKPEYKDDSTKLYKDMTAIWGGASDNNGESLRAKVRVSVNVINFDPIIHVVPYLPLKPRKGKYGIELKPDMSASSFYALWFAKPKETSLLPETLHELKSPEWSDEHRNYCRKLNELVEFKDEKSPLRQLIWPGVIWHLDVDIDSKNLSSEKLRQVQDCLNAWLQLGGIGGRTTRGLGRSKLIKIKQQTSEMLILSDILDTTATWFQQSFGDQNALRDDHPNSPIISWDRALQIYRSYRQARQYAQLDNDKNPKRMKQSYGHFANGLRKSTKCKGHSLPIALEDEFKKFSLLPEVMFGAPIGYEFTGKSKEKEPPKGEVRIKPPNSQKSYERYTSPVIITAVHQPNGKYIPAALVFKNHWDDLKDKDIEIKLLEKQLQIPVPAGQWWPDLSTQEGKDIGKQLLGKSARNGLHFDMPNEIDPLYDELIDAVNLPHVQGDPLQAFLNFFYSHDLNLK